MKLIIVPIVAILAIVGIVCFALYLGFNGVLISGSAILIGGLGGYEIKVLKDKINKPK